MNNDDLPEDSAALVLNADGTTQLHFPQKALNRTDDAPVPDNCLLLAALGKALYDGSPHVQAILDDFTASVETLRQTESE